MQQEVRGSRFFTALFLLMVFLSPIAFFPGASNLTFVAKLAVVVTISAVLLTFLLLSALNSGFIDLPRTKLLPALLILPLAAIASSLFSGNFSNSIFGSSFEIGTAGSFIILFIVFLISAIFGLKEGLSKKALAVYLLSGAVLILYTIFIAVLSLASLSLPFSLPTALSFNYIELSILLGAVIVIALCTLNFYRPARKSAAVMWAAIIASLLILGAVSFKPILIALSIISLILYVYTRSVSYGGGGGPKSSRAVLAVLIVSVVLALSGNLLSRPLSGALKINSFDVRPSWSATAQIIKMQWQDNFLTGAGPNNFAKLWAVHKPLDVNLTQFWNTDFYFGSSLMATLAATLGLVGILPIIFFFSVYLTAGFKAFFQPTDFGDKKILSITTFLASLFLWISAFIYIPSMAVMTMAAVSTGLFTASLAHIGAVPVSRFNIFLNPRTNFVSVLVGVILIIGTLSSAYLVWQKVVASVIFNKSATEFGATGDVARAQAAITRATNISSHDSYERALSELHLIDIERLITALPPGGNIGEAERAELQNKVASALSHARSAIELDRGNHQNHIAIARIYELLAFRGVPGAGESASAAYLEAQKLSPVNPQIELGLARIAALSGNVEQSRIHIGKTLELKRNYTDAYFTLAQLEAGSNNLPGVVAAVEAATIVDPTNAGLYFQLGLIKYQSGDASGAAAALERATAIAQDYANARYFLGLSYHALGRREEAIKQFEDIEKTNPDNDEVKLILSNLKNNKQPFAGARPPLDDEPEKRKVPPIEEN